MLDRLLALARQQVTGNVAQAVRGREQHDSGLTLAGRPVAVRHPDLILTRSTGRRRRRSEKAQVVGASDTNRR